MLQHRLLETRGWVGCIPQIGLLQELGWQLRSDRIRLRADRGLPNKAISDYRNERLAQIRNLPSQHLKIERTPLACAPTGFFLCSY
jgi:hypothetical protein